MGNELQEVIHNIGINPCNKAAFYWKGEHKIGTPIFSSKVVYLNGEQAQSGDRMICGNCGMFLNRLTYTLSCGSFIGDVNRF